MSPLPSQTDTAPLRLGVIVGSVRADRFGPTPARWIADEATKRDDWQVDLIDLADHPCPAVLPGDDADAPLPEPVAALGERLERADGFIVVTPVYNRSFPASLKHAVDWFYRPWQLKPVGLMSYGGITGGLQAIEGLRGVFTEFNAVCMRDTITIADCWNAFGDDGRPIDAERMDRLASSFLDQLAWWARTLRNSRAERPYPFTASQ